MMIQRKKKAVMAEEEVMVAPEASELLFEAEDVAELVAEVTGEEVEVETTKEDEVVFTVADEEFVVTPDEDIQEVESCRKMSRGAKPVKASKARRVIRRK